MMKKVYSFIISVVLCMILVVSLTACNASGSKGYVADGIPSESNDEKSDSVDVSVVETDRKIIYSSWATIQTKEFEKSVDEINSLCKKYEAYFETSRVTGTDMSSKTAYYTIRVPVKNYAAFVKEAGATGNVVESGENNKDVTEKYVDTEARLASAKARETRLLELLDKAERLSDVLAIEAELSNVRYEIESYTGSLKKLDSLIDYATFTLTLAEVADYTAPATTFWQRITDTFQSGLKAFANFWKEICVAITYLAPTIVLSVVAAIIIAVIVKRKRKKNSRSTCKAEVDTATIKVAADSKNVQKVSETDGNDIFEQIK